MSTCPHCGGLLGRDCFNPQECGEIAHAEQMRIEHERDNLAGCVDARDERIRALEEALRMVCDSFRKQEGRFLEIMGDSNPRLQNFQQDVRKVEALLAAGWEGGK